MSPSLPIDSWARGIVYKPGWTFDIAEQEGGEPLLRATVEVADARLPGRTTMVTAVVPLGEASRSSESAFQHRVLALVDHLERHEVREWLTFDGRRVFDPHS